MLAHGVRIATSCTISRVDKSLLHVKGQESVPYGILLWVAGNKSVSLVDGGLAGARKSEKGLVRVLTDGHLRVKRVADEKKGSSGEEVWEDVFALGDAADIDGSPLPTTAEVAVQKAQYLVQTLNAQAARARKPFVYNPRRLVTYIGFHDGIAQGSGVHAWSGRQAWLSWRSGSFTWTRSWRNWIGVLVAWVLNALFGRDVMRL